MALFEQVVRRLFTVLGIIPLAFVAGFTQMALYYTVSPVLPKFVTQSRMLWLAISV